MRYKIAIRPCADSRRREAEDARRRVRCARCGRVFTLTRVRRGLCPCEVCRKAVAARTEGGARHD